MPNLFLLFLLLAVSIIPSVQSQSQETNSSINYHAIVVEQLRDKNYQTYPSGYPSLDSYDGIRVAGIQLENNALLIAYIVLRVNTLNFPNALFINRTDTGKSYFITDYQTNDLIKPRLWISNGHVYVYTAYDSNIGSYDGIIYDLTTNSTIKIISSINNIVTYPVLIMGERFNQHFLYNFTIRTEENRTIFSFDDLLPDLTYSYILPDEINASELENLNFLHLNNNLFLLYIPSS